MHPFIAKTFGGLSTQYYVRQFLFGLIFPVLILVALNYGTKPIPVKLTMYVLLAVNSLLYPYSRFVYETVVGYIVGQNIFIVNAIFTLFMKLLTMMICWCFAVFIAPIGLIYLYIYHSRREVG